ncbi:hypothetical protein [Nocardia spumae]|uniref:hypothetical protein n=1 Tax=Nocardia spumae TaxID=2887190 RepID=UPI001D144AF3|nr:hypothetical protein [Nocardia spumae]
MNRVTIVVLAVVVIAAIEVIGLQNERELLPVLLGVPVLGALVWLLWSLVERARAQQVSDEDDHEFENGPAEMLSRWHARAQMLATRADGTRADWDRYLRPLLAKEFELSSGHRISKNRKATEVAGKLQFGPELWRWVDPANSSPRDQTSRAPGRTALDEILRRLQDM